MGAKLDAFGVNFAEYGYSIYLVSGILAWNAFASVVVRTTNIYKDKAGLIAKVNINLALLPLYILLSESIIFIISMIFFVAFLWGINFPITQYWLFLPLLYLLQLLFAYALGFLCATLGVFIKDIREFIGVIIHLWFWCTPIVYVVKILPENFQFWFQLNPMYQLIGAYRSLIIEQQLPQFTGLGLLAATSLSLLLFSLYVFRQLEKDLRDIL